jgi:glutamate-5-semialdehyde dehydrogenase
MCHLYVHEDADLEMATRILLNGKTQRPGVCNALETVLVHEKIVESGLLKFEQSLCSFQVQYYADPRSYVVLKSLGVPPDRLHQATPESFDQEYLDLILNVAVVSSLDEAIRHIEAHGSRHSEAIVTASENTARTFQNAVDAAVVYWNASTRFTDGNQLGLGAEIGISTQKLHVRGPVGLQALTSVRWLIDGNGQVRS